MLTFSAEGHQYFWNGRPVVNVTRVLSLITDYSSIAEHVLNHARDEGIAIHKLVELYCHGDLDEDSLPDWLKPRLAAFKKFVADTGFEIAESEQRVYHERHGYAGQLDFHGTIRQRHGRKDVQLPAIVDVKRSFYAGRAIGLQLAAYAAALDSKGRSRVGVAWRRYALQLRDNGEYRLKQFADPSDLANFLALLTTYRLKESINA